MRRPALSASLRTRLGPRRQARACQPDCQPGWAIPGPRPWPVPPCQSNLNSVGPGRADLKAAAAASAASPSSSGPGPSAAVPLRLPESGSEQRRRRGPSGTANDLNTRLPLAEFTDTARALSARAAPGRPGARRDFGTQQDYSPVTFH